MKKAFVVVLGFVLVLSFAALAAAQQPIVWKMQSTWTAADNHQVSANKFAEKVNAMAGGRLKIEVSAAGAIVPAFEVLDAVHKGSWMPGIPGRGTGSGNIPPAPFTAARPGTFRDG